MKKHNRFSLAIASLLASVPANLILRNDLSAEGRELLAALNKTTDEVKNLALDAQKKTGELSDTLRAEIDKQATAQGELRAQLAEVSQEIAAKLVASAGAVAPKSLGALFVESEATKNAMARGLNAVGDRFSVRLNNAVSSATGSGAALVPEQRLPGIVPGPEQRLTIRDLLMWGRTVSNAVEFARELVFTNNAAPVSETVKKPESGLTFEMASVPVATIAHFIKASKQILADAPMLQSYIDGKLRYGLKLKEEAQLLKGSGTGLNLTGLYTAATAYSNPGVTVTSENRMDRLRLALLQAELAEYPADGIVLSPIDWCSIELSKTASDKQYLVGNPFGTMTPTLWGRPVVATQSMDAGEYLVGAFGMAAQGWDREDINVAVALENEDDFVKNMVTLRCEERLALTIYRSAALIKGDFDSLT